MGLAAVVGEWREVRSGDCDCCVEWDKKMLAIADAFVAFSATSMNGKRDFPSQG